MSLRKYCLFRLPGHQEAILESRFPGFGINPTLVKCARPVDGCFNLSRPSGNNEGNCDTSFDTKCHKSSWARKGCTYAICHQGCQMAKFDPSLSLDSPRVDPRRARDHILQRSVVEPKSFKPEGPNKYNLNIWLSPSGNLVSRTQFNPLPPIQVWTS